jgi:hypothetical protein
LEWKRIGGIELKPPYSFNDLVEVIIDFADGESPQTIHELTGQDIERCKEIEEMVGYFTRERRGW